LSGTASRARRKAGLLLNRPKTGTRDALTRYTTPVTGAYYLVPSIESIAGLAGDAFAE
jgi:porphyrinogen peroxidase